MQKNNDWDLIIEGKSSLFDLQFQDVWRYRDLLLMFVKNVQPNKIINTNYKK